MRYLYSLALLCLTPLLLLRSARKYAGDQWGARQRLGLGCPRLNRPIWIHAASVGEARAIAPLAQSMAAEYPILITTTTPTGRDQVRNLTPDAVHAFLPYDLPWAMHYWIRRLNPRALVLVETELWPNLIHSAYSQSVPVVLANGRMSEKSERGYAKLSALTRPMLEKMQVLAQTEQHQAAFLRLGATQVQVLGNLKYDLPTPSDDQVTLAEQQLGAGTWWVAASTHESEERACLDAFKALQNTHPDLRLLLVPRHPQRFDAVAQLAQAKFPGAQRLSQVKSADSPVVIGDAMGQLQAWLSQARVVFVGGTLVEHGGQSPIESAAAGAAIVAGPSRYNFPQVFQLLGDGALVDVQPDGLVAGVTQALSMDGAINSQLINAHRGASERTVEAIRRLVVAE